jgi:hypothetical protein
MRTAGKCVMQELAAESLFSYQHALWPISDPTIPAILLTYLVASCTLASYPSGHTALIRLSEDQCGM